jgi:transcriptional regulator with XRE-family HTH domain
MHCVTQATLARDAMSITFFNPASQCPTLSRYDGRLVAKKRPVFHPELAEFFRELREKRAGLGFRQVVKLAQERGLTAITHETLRGLEKGTTENPKSEVLRAAAAFYKIPYEELASRFIEANYGIVITAPGQAGTEPGTSIQTKAAQKATNGAVAVELPPDSVSALEEVVAAAASLVELGERIQERAEKVLGRQDADTRTRTTSRIARRGVGRRSATQRTRKQT